MHPRSAGAVTRQHHPLWQVRALRDWLSRPRDTLCRQGLSTVAAALLLVVALAVRLIPLGRYVTPDEPAWVHRSILFADAVAARDWSAVPSTGHPGVTTMWLGAASVAARQAVDPEASAAHLDWIRRMAWLSPDNAEAFRHLGFFLPWGRFSVAVAAVLGLAVVYRIVARLTSTPSALVALGLLTFDPFLVGHSSLLHTDALLATFTSISVLALLVALRSESNGYVWAIASGLAGGLALGTKTLAVALAAYAVAALGIGWISGRIRLGEALVLTALWGVSFMGAFWAIYPAMWTAPGETLQDLLGSPAYQSTTALTPTFFAGRTALTHGPEFYVVAVLYRISPVVLVGLVRSFRPIRVRRSSRLELALLWLFACGYVGMLALSPKKFDRYLLPVLFLLAVVAAVALVRGPQSDRAATNSGQSSPRGASWMRMAAPVLLQAALLIPFAAHPLTSFNLLFGGPWVARRLLETDWGEGVGAAANWLNGEPEASELTVAAASIPSFASIYAGRTVPLSKASLAERVVSSTAFEVGAKPLYIARSGLLPGPAVYPNQATEEQSSFFASHVGPHDLIIADADIPLVRQYGGPGTMLSAAALPDDAAMASLVDEYSAGAARIWLVHDLAASPITADITRRVLDSAGTPPTTARVGAATISEYRHVGPFIPEGGPQVLAFGGQLALLEARLPGDPVRGAFSILLRWRALRPTDARLYASLYLRDETGQVWSEVGQPIVDDYAFPTTAWSKGAWTDAAMIVTTPALLAPGEYEIALTLTDGQGAQLGTWDSAGSFRGVRPLLGSVMVAAPAVEAGVQDCVHGDQLDGGPFQACVQAPVPASVPSGDAVMVDVTWSATDQPSGDYSVRLALANEAGEVVSIQIVDLSSYATSRWRKGDSYSARYALRTDPALPPGTYGLELAVIGPEGPVDWAQHHAPVPVVIMGRERAFILPDAIEYPLDLAMGSDIRLRGFDLATGADGRNEPRPGDPVSIRLYWQADGPTGVSYTVFVQLLGPDGLAHGQVDRIPAAGRAPTTSWAPGQVIVDELSVTLGESAPEGAYTIAVGLYDAETGIRLPIVDEFGAASPGQQAVLPVGFAVVGDQP